ncbi:DUF5320 domain-containing protein [Candidatus Uhrbacteria bacterium]|nr:DUF5320 domain-containing protein [Candidatus Uhrbacteria bacterium]
MPRMNGTGPNGQGPMTGRGQGPCNGGRPVGRCGRVGGFGFGRGFGFRADSRQSLDEEEQALRNRLEAIREERESSGGR